MAKKYIKLMKKADFNLLAKKFNLDPVIMRLLVNRDIKEEDMESYLYPKESDINSPYILKDVEEAARAIKQFIEEHKKIRIIGDYDVDGIMSTYILVSSLRNLGANVDYDIPNRVTDGYGINERLVRKAKEDGVDMIITCDNGIAAYDAIELSEKEGIFTIVTDHHLVPYEIINEKKVEKLPPSHFVVNPHRKDDESKFKEICGAVVAYKVCLVLYDIFNKDNYYVRSKLKYAAMATICDVMPLIDENRAIVKIGLKELTEVKNIPFEDIQSINGNNDESGGFDLLNERSDQNEIAYQNERSDQNEIADQNERSDKKEIAYKNDISDKYVTSEDIPIKELMEAAGVKNYVSSFTIGFMIGPIFNASGRISDAKIAVEMLLCKDIEKIKEAAKNLVELNSIRKNKTKEATEEAQVQVEKYKDDDVLVLYLKDLHESIAGIVAGRIKEQENKPTIVLVDGKNFAKGSGRSIDSYLMYDELHKCEDLLLKYGGHKKAAGLSLEADNIDELRKRLNKNSSLTEDDFVSTVNIDVVMPISYISIKLIKEVGILEPFGEMNAKPLFADQNIRILKIREIGKDKNYLKFDLLDEKNRVVDAVMFSGAEEAKAKLIERYGDSIITESSYKNLNPNVTITFTYYPSINEYHNIENIQVVIQDIL